MVAHSTSFRSTSFRSDLISSYYICTGYEVFDTREAGASLVLSLKKKYAFINILIYEPVKVLGSINTVRYSIVTLAITPVGSITPSGLAAQTVQIANSDAFEAELFLS